jgi:hypothetical protein
MRQKDKIEKYLDRLIKKYNGTLQESEFSRYYSIRGRILRISDHVGKSSDGNISIIFDSSDQGHYIIHGHTSGNISVLNYEQTKEFVRSFIRTSFLFKDLNSIPSNNRAEEIVNPKVVPNGLFTQEVANYLITAFSKKQLQQMLGFLKGEKKKHKQYLELLAIL